MRPLRFILNDELVELDSVDPTHTVLDWIREDAGLKGTKEGCAAGDCGACTVVVGRLQADGSLHYQPVNACILFMPVMDGTHVITVEHLKGPDGQLHPVQQALVDYHGSQCGFCTPGFVMTLFSLYLNQRECPSRQQITDMISGNLCRCTGYRPIIDAAEAMYGYAWEDPTLAALDQTADKLKALAADTESLAIEGNGRRFFAPTKVADLDALLADYPDAVLLAGGTDIGLWVTKQHMDLNPIIYLGHVDALHGIQEDEQTLTIGAAETLTDAMDSLVRNYPDLDVFMTRFGSPMIRNSGTIGGNIGTGSPIGDTLPAAIALGATITLRHQGQTRVMPLEDLYVDYRQQNREQGEYVLNIQLPKLAADEYFRCYKLTKRLEQDISTAAAAFKLGLDDNNIVKTFGAAFGGVGPTPLRAVQLEQTLIGKPWNEQALEEAEAVLAAELAPFVDVSNCEDEARRSRRIYRRSVTVNLLRKFFIETHQPDTKVRVFEHQEAEA